MRHAIAGIAAALLALAGSAPGRAEELKLMVGRSAVIDYSGDVARISTSNAEIADAVAVSTREVLVNAKAAGAATLIIWARSGTRTVYAVDVEPNVEPVRQLLRRSFPEADIQVHAARDALALTGTVSSPAMAERATALVAPFAKAVVNNLKVVSPGPEKQVLLRVKFAELNRNVTTAFGVNLVSTGAGNTPGMITTGQFQNPTINSIERSSTATKFTISDALNVFAFRPDLNLAAFLKALESRGLMQILAEPNLVATNGKDASFLVGGEFPVPIVQGGANAGAVTIVFKEFGIRLTFQPNITEHNTIRMYVKPEVSTMDFANAVLYSGFTIPALATRRMETSIELGEGQSFLIAGLIDQRVTENMSKIPGLANLPVLGVLFRSRNLNRASTELVVMVTPEITTPASGSALKMPGMPKPFLPPILIERNEGTAPPSAATKTKTGKRTRKTGR